MTTAAVVDASAAVALLFAEPGAFHVGELLYRFRRYVVPPLFLVETANVGRTKVKRGELTWGQADAALAQLDLWPLDEAPVPWRSALATSRRSGLSVYDAVYLSLAIERDLPLITLDDALRSSAGRRALR